MYVQQIHVYLHQNDTERKFRSHKGPYATDTNLIGRNV